ncbi:MAG: ATP phosphoribosyltransferase regulatory subunit [Salaquimonas sp.]
MTALTLQIENFLKTRRCALPDIGLLQPADPILNAAGEDIRRRIFMTADQHGKDMCLRPEFTIPVCLQHIAMGKQRKRYGYVGKVFRQRADEPAEFVQAGIEDIGAKNTVLADANALKDAAEMLQSLGKGRLSVVVGDQAIFGEVLKSLGLPKAWRERLGRAFGDKDRLRADLDRLEGKTVEPFADMDSALVQALREKDRLTIHTHVSNELERAGIATSGGRTSEEITARLMEKAELASTQLSPMKREILESFLSLDIPAANANSRLWSFSRKANIPLGPSLENFHKRIAAIEKLQLENVSIRYQSAFGRQLDYYTGFVFEIRGAGRSKGKPLAGGGRYDRLMTVLGAKEKAPAIGFAVYVDRVVPAKSRGAQ